MQIGSAWQACPCTHADPASSTSHAVAHAPPTQLRLDGQVPPLAHELSPGSSHTCPMSLATHSCPAGQSRCCSHASWQRLKTQTSGELQSLFSEHPAARPTALLDEVQLAVAPATSVDPAATATTQTAILRDIDDPSPDNRHGRPCPFQKSSRHA